MLEMWLPLLVIVILAWSWHHVLQLREHVTAYARQLCAQRGVQLLDDSVALHRMRVNWRRGSPHIVREYRFETSIGGNDRKTASIVLSGGQVTATSMPEYPTAEPARRASALTAWHTPTPPVTVTVADAQDNVIPISRARRTLH